MYCDVCKQFTQGKFCNKCGTKLGVPDANSENRTNRCSKCSTELTGEFCSECGCKDSGRPMTFTEFKDKTSDKRRNLFKSKHKLKKTDLRVVDQTLITIKLMLVKEDGTLNARGGFSIPLSVNSSDNAFTVKKAAFNKMTRYCNDFACQDISDCKLVYKNGEKVRYLPGTNTEFTVKSYKDDSGLPYSRITLYLQPYESTDNDVDDKDWKEEASDGDLPQPFAYRYHMEEGSNVASTSTSLTGSVEKVLDKDQRKICPKCCTTNASEFCLRCHQNKEFENSMQNDKTKSIIIVDDEVSMVVPVKKAIDITIDRSIMDHSYANGSFDTDVFTDSNQITHSSTQINSVSADEMLEIRNRRKIQMLPEEELSVEHTVVTVKHPVNGHLRRIVSPDSTYKIIYNWIGSLEETPICFNLCKSPLSPLSPSEKIGNQEDYILHLEESHERFDVDNDGDDSLSVDLFESMEKNRKSARNKLSMYSLVSATPNTYTVRRHSILDDIFEIYEKDITNNIISIIFDEEPAVGEGVTREAFSVFFRDLFQLKSSGVNSNVPMALSGTQAKCLGKLVTHSYIQSNFFPVQISKACFEYAVFGKVRETSLLSSFLLFVQKNERLLLEKILNEEKDAFYGEEKDIIWEIFIDAGVTAIPTPSTVKELMIKAANIVFIERPCFILIAFKDGLGNFWEKMSYQELDCLWSRYTPTVDNVIKYFVFDPSTPSEETVQSYFIRYIRSLDEDTLSLLVQYCTGATIVEPGSHVQVIFENRDGRCMWLKAMACFKILYLPRYVSSYKVFRCACEDTLRTKSFWSMSG